jgi:hypothetical protein
VDSAAAAILAAVALAAIGNFTASSYQSTKTDNCYLMTEYEKSI